MVTEQSGQRTHSSSVGSPKGSVAAAARHDGLAESRRISAELDALIAPAALGDQRAVTEVVRLVHPLVRRYCVARLGNPAHLQVTVDDVVQEILLATVTAIPRYRDQGKSFLAFVYGIAANKVSDAFRRSSQHRDYPTSELPDTPSSAAGPEELALVGEQRAMAKELMKMLTPKHREVLVMRIVLGWSAAQTAEAIGTSPGVVRVIQHRALTRLRAEVRSAC